jgi:hypothetical protein
MSELFSSIAETLPLDAETLAFAKGVTDKDLADSRVDISGLESEDKDVAKLTCLTALARLFDMSKNYVVFAGDGVILCQHSCYTELPISTKSKIKLMKYGRLELKNLWAIAYENNLYDVTELIRRVRELPTIKFRSV